jgi:hypothetical protein
MERMTGGQSVTSMSRERIEDRAKNVVTRLW